MKNKNNNGNGESKIRKVLFNEISFVIAIIGVAASIIFWMTGMPGENKTEIEKLKIQIEGSQELSTQLQNIKDNDLHTLELKVNDVEDAVKANNDTLIELKTILNERLPAKY